MFCTNCGKEIRANSEFCDSCGCHVDKNQTSFDDLKLSNTYRPHENIENSSVNNTSRPNIYDNNYNQQSNGYYNNNYNNNPNNYNNNYNTNPNNYNQQPAQADNGGFGWGFLGFIFPLVGLILFLVWNATRPRTAKSAGVGALISVICIVLFYVFIFFMAMFAATQSVPAPAPPYYY